MNPKIKLFQTKLLLVVALFLSGSWLFGQGTTCQESEPFCTGTIYTFPAGTSGSAQPGAYYGCLLTQPAPAWYHMLIEDPGPITIYMYSTPLVDIDFICWGPFNDPYDPCVAGLTQSKVVDCSYSPNPTEYCNIPNGQTGEYYILLITNYSQQVCNITFSQTGGTGSTDCTILPPPVGNNGPLCIGETLELTASFVVNATYLWSGPAGFISTQQNPVIPNVTLSNAGDYSCVITVNGNSSDPAVTNVIINNKPTASLLSEDTTICSGTSAHAIFQLIGASPFTIHYSDGANTFMAEGLMGPMDTVFLSPAAGPTQYSFSKVEDINCERTLVSVNMTVGLHPFTSGEISGNNTLCAGESGELVFNLTGTPPWSVVYTENGTNPQTINANSTPHYKTVSPALTTLYELASVSDVNCDGETSGSALLTVEPTPVAGAGTDQTISYGAFTTLNGSATGGSGGYSYHWEPANKLVNPNVQQPQTVNLTETVVFTLTATDNSSDCDDTDQVTITIEGGPLGCYPTAEPSVICDGESTQLNAMASGGSGDYTYLWTSNPSGFSSDLPSPVVTPGQTTLYTVTVDDGFNLSTGNITVTVNELPVPEAGNDITIANGTNTTLQGAASGGSGNYTYHWEPAGKLDNPDIANPQTVNLFATTVFTLTVTDIITGCVAEDPDQMSVVVTGDFLSVNPSAQPEEICLGESLELFASAGGGSGSYTYQWTSDNGFSSTLANPVITPSEAGSFIYHCAVDDGFNTANGSVGIYVKPQPYVNLGSGDTVVCVYDTIVLDAGNPGASYLWSNGSTEKQVRVGSTGIGFDIKTFSVTVTEESGCYAEDTITIMFDFGACSGVDDSREEPFVRLYPNPGSGLLNIQAEWTAKVVNINILDPVGKVLRSFSGDQTASDDQTLQIDISNLNEGLYFIQFVVENKNSMLMKYLLVK